MVSSRRELIGFLERPSQSKQEGNNDAADKQGNTPSPRRHFFRGQPRIKQNAKEGGKHYRNLLARRLPAYVEALVSGRRDFGQVNRNATQLHTRRESLQKPTN